MKHWKFVLLLSTGLVFISAAAASLSISPDSFSDDVTAGQEFSQNMTVEWTGDESTTVMMNYKIENSDRMDASKGFSVDFEPREFDIGSDDEVEVDALVSSRPGVQDDTYSVDFRAWAEIPDDSSGGGAGGSSDLLITDEDGLVERVNQSDWESVNEELNETIEELEERQRDLERLRDERGEDIDLIEELEDEIRDLESRRDELESERGDLLESVERSNRFMFSLLLVSLAGVLFVGYRRNREEILERAGVLKSRFFGQGQTQDDEILDSEAEL